MREQFKEVNFRQDRVEMVDLCNQIIDGYLAQGLRLTLRQLYYQLVTRNAIPNSEKSYKSIGNLVSDARLAGQIDWDAIEDRVRVPRKPSEFRDLSELVDAALYSYRLPRWKGQDNYIELWVEKDALSGVLAPLATEYHITLMVNRGYSSQSAMYESAKRFIENSVKDSELPDIYVEDNQRNCILFYLGDHDPSGEDMVRDIRDRLEMLGANVTVQKIALTMAQVRQYNPPPNPAKLTDTRAAGYITEHGNSSWEVDALPPEVLQTLIREAIETYLDSALMDEIKEREEQDKNRLRSFVKGIKEP